MTGLNLPNIAKLRAVIAADLEAHEGKHFAIANWVSYLSGDPDTRHDGSDGPGRKVYMERSYEPCNTAFCFAGHINFLALSEKMPADAIAKMDGCDFKYTMGRTDDAQQWLGIDYDQRGDMFLMICDGSKHSAPLLRHCFDLLPSKERAELALRYLDNLVEGNGLKHTSWHDLGCDNWVTPERKAEYRSLYGYGND